jgi:hypothetical protein
MAASSVDLPTSFQRHLRAENKSVHTVETYLEAVQQLDAFLHTRAHRGAAAAAGHLRRPGLRGSPRRRLDPGCSSTPSADAWRSGACAWAMWTSSTTWCWWSAREAASGPAIQQPDRRGDRPVPTRPCPPRPCRSGVVAVGGLDVSGDAATLRRLGRGRARPRGPSTPFASRPAVADEGSPVGAWKGSPVRSTRRRWRACQGPDHSLESAYERKTPLRSGPNWA